MTHEPAVRPPVAAIVLAAGRASRFGGDKVLARLEGRPLLQHVLDAVADASVREVVVVHGPDGADRLADAIKWRDERCVENPRPDDGLASSVKVGLAAVSDDAGSALILLADQPRVRSIVIRRLVEAWRAGAGPIVAPRYSRDGAPNPVLVDRTAWPLAFALDGDRGLGPVLREHPVLVRWLDVAGDNPDVDTAADLERLAAHGT